MLKNISNFGKTLNKTEQQSINGGNTGMACSHHDDCLILNSLPYYEYEEFFCMWGYCQIQ
jgi:hypothetical protein